MRDAPLDEVVTALREDGWEAQASIVALDVRVVARQADDAGASFRARYRIDRVDGTATCREFELWGPERGVYAQIEDDGLVYVDPELVGEERATADRLAQLVPGLLTRALRPLHAWLWGDE